MAVMNKARDVASTSSSPDEATSPAPPPYADLTPDAVLNAIDAIGRAAGLVTTGALLTLNSYENRVFQVGVEESDGRAGFVVAKFYRPGRWTDAQILEEHEFTAELAEREIPVAAPLRLAGATLHHVAGHRVALFPRRGGRAPDLARRDVREWLGRFIGRIHAVGALRPYAYRPALDIESFGRKPGTWLLERRWLPDDLHEPYRAVFAQALAGVQACYERAGRVRAIRLHGDCHEGNVLWTDAGPHFVDFDDSRMGPAVQDLWMLLAGSREEMQAQLADVLAGYEDFLDFDRRELHLVEALRTLRLVHYAAWIARRWTDPAFPAAFPWFGTPRYWQDRILELREQISAMAEPQLAV